VAGCARAGQGEGANMGNIAALAKIAKNASLLDGDTC
jgi:hypothetical protein